MSAASILECLIVLTHRDGAQFVDHQPRDGSGRDRRLCGIGTGSCSGERRARPDGRADFPAALDGLLLTPAEVNAALSATGMTLDKTRKWLVDDSGQIEA